MFYFTKTPWWLKKLYNGCTWEMPDKAKTMYLTFDDGPHPVITPFVLDELKKYNAKATFFCIGNNVMLYPEIYERILAEGHSVGNHTYDHVNGWKTPAALYISNVDAAAKLINSKLFRPPYGKITFPQLKMLTVKNEPYKVVMWKVLSGDFDINISPLKCFDNVIKNSREGSIIVFHDSEKAFDRMGYTLPLVLKYFAEKGYSFENICL